MRADHRVPQGDPRRTWSELPALIVVAGLVASAFVLIPEQLGYRAACTGVTATCVLAALMRLTLPRPWVGVLAVRSRSVDVLVLVAMAVAVSVLAFSVPLPG